MADNKRNSGVMKAVLKAFVPYSKENLMLTYKPNKFFNYLDELERQTGADRNTLHVTISRAKRAGLIRIDPKTNQPVTTWRGKLKIKAKPENKSQRYLIVIFDIPESMRRQRDQLRTYLQNTYAEPVQKSVWKTQYDIHDELNEAVRELNIERYVTQFLADEI